MRQWRGNDFHFTLTRGVVGKNKCQAVYFSLLLLYMFIDVVLEIAKFVLKSACFYC